MSSTWVWFHFPCACSRSWLDTWSCYLFHHSSSVYSSFLILYGLSSPISLVTILFSISIHSCYKQAMEYKYWQNAMQAKLQALKENHTQSKWVFSWNFVLMAPWISTKLVVRLWVIDINMGWLWRDICSCRQNDHSSNNLSYCYLTILVITSNICEECFSS